jgi:hypothetical protein
MVVVEFATINPLLSGAGWRVAATKVANSVWTDDCNVWDAKILKANVKRARANSMKDRDKKHAKINCKGDKTEKSLH